jgi:hypothetical protein
MNWQGSTVGRYIDAKEREKKAGKPTVLKDLNFLEMGKKIILGPEKGKLFLEQMKKDAEVPTHFVFAFAGDFFFFLICNHEFFILLFSLSFFHSFWLE